MLATTFTCAHQGVDTYVVRVEARVTSGLPQLVIVGLADAAVREGRERVRGAIKATVSGFPLGRIVINLSPASRRKAGASFDLAIAMALFGAAEICPQSALRDTVFIGELGLDGSLRAVAGALPAAIAARRSGRKRLVLPRGSAKEAAVIRGVDVHPAGCLADVLELVQGGYREEPLVVDAARLLAEAPVATGPDLADVRGQATARRALEIAAAGSHHLLMTGPPGGGKTMLARRLPSILPPLSLDDAIQTTAIHSIAGLAHDTSLITTRPFRAPHHTTSGGGMVGGGTNPGPGEVSLAHNGVLFLDELPEFAPNVLNQLREPLQDGFLTISRVSGRLTFPAAVMLVAAMNPCPCGYEGCRTRPCRCAEHDVRRYRARVSGPLMDRIDLHVAVPRVEFAELATQRPGASSAEVRRRVASARALRAQAVATAGARPGLDAEVEALLSRAADRLQLSARGVGSTIAVALTIACLAGRTAIRGADVAEALQYRSNGEP